MVAGVGRKIAIEKYYCPENAFKLFKIQYLSNYKPQYFIDRFIDAH